MPAGLEDRDADICEPLLAIADAAGGQWPKRARDRIWTTELVDKLCARDESPWQELRNGQGINDRTLAKRLVEYGIKSGSVRIGEPHRKG